MANKPLTLLPTGYKSSCSVTASNHTQREKICTENMGETLGDRIGLSDEVINAAASLAMKAHDCTGKPFLRKKGLPVTVFAFAGSWLPDDWCAQPPFGETKMDTSNFPSLKSLGDDGVALVNGSFPPAIQCHPIITCQKGEKSNWREEASCFHRLLVGCSGGHPGNSIPLGEVRAQSEPTPLRHFRIPLVGDRIFGHAVRREKWSDHFIHFVMRYDLIPRIMLGPSSTEHKQILDFFNPGSESFRKHTDSSLGLYSSVMRNASMVANYDACNFMGCKIPALETLRNFIELSPYRPFGTYIFFSGSGKPWSQEEDAEAAKQWSQEEDAEAAKKGLNEHLAYQLKKLQSLGKQNVVYLDHLEELPVSSDGSPATVNTTLNDLGLSTQAMLCLQATGELEKRKSRNQDKIINDYKQKIEGELRKLSKYKEKAETCGLGYYDSFKLQEKEDDFQANVSRLVLAGYWDEMMEMLKAYELPDEFEKSHDFILLGTDYRRTVEPLDIANFYRHAKDEETGFYVKKGTRPKRYRYIQNWLEHAEKKPSGSRSESCFWAEVEDLRIKTRSNGSSPEIKQKVQQLGQNLIKWIDDESLGKDVLLENSTFVKWWKPLPPEYKSEPESSRIMKLIH
ncbi:Protein EDS1 [Vitis vinifera]|uniref:Protein EDS1 n=1 Tax=Vitis vinifera TaxID=29760 RepID=A0A438CD60_VITVI|nr:Protein EDS1 [Vitis vinifera]